MSDGPSSSSPPGGYAGAKNLKIGVQPTAIRPDHEIVLAIRSDIGGLLDAGRGANGNAGRIEDETLRANPRSVDVGGGVRAAAGAGIAPDDKVIARAESDDRSRLRL